jgi:hypothetical protein
MRGAIKIGTKDVEMLANAASPYLYSQLFHEDFLQILQNNPSANIFEKMGYVMACQASMPIEELFKGLKLEDFYKWLGEFEPMDILNASKEIAELYAGQEVQLSSPKAKDA